MTYILSTKSDIKATTIVRNCGFRNADNKLQTERMTAHRQTRWLLIDQKRFTAVLNYANADKL